MKQQEIIDQIGGYNDFPPGWREITPHEYAVQVNNHCHCILKTEYRHMFSGKDLLNGKVPVDAVLIVFNDLTGVASSSSHQRLNDGFGYITKFWAFGCNHSFKEIPWDSKYGTRLNRQHLWKCSECGQTLIVDSSD